MAESLNQLKEKFFEETLELVHELEEILLTSGNELDNVSVDAVFRIIHNIKGSGGLLGFEHILEITHNLEDIYENVRSKESAFTNELLNITLESVDVLKKLIASNEVLDETLQDEYRDVVNRIINYEMQFANGEERKVANKEKIGAKKEIKSIFGQTYLIQFKPAKGFNTSGIDPRFIIEEFRLMGDLIAFENDKKIKDFDGYKPVVNPEWLIVIETNDTIDALKEVFAVGKEFIKYDVVLLSDFDLIAFPEVVEFISSSVAAGNFDTLNDFKQKIEVFANNEIGEDILKRSAQIKKGKDAKANAARKSKDKIVKSIRVDTDKVDQLMKLVSEMVTLQARLDLLVNQQGDSELIEIAEKYKSFSKLLRDNAFSISLVPFAITTTRYRRLIHDLSSKLNKKVIFEAEGDETELDKKIIEQLSDPVIHLLRNCIDHGIESPEERINSGKTAEGHIWIKVSPHSNYVYIEISDDGKGIDIENIKKKAVEKGLVSNAEELKESDWLDKIFLPGFSTAEKVSDVSGRGVGLDVVKKNISDIRGEIEVKTHPGKGTSFILKLPLTLSIIDGMQVRIGDRNFIIPLSNVEKIFPITAEDFGNSGLNNFLIIEGEQIPYFDLRSDFELDSEVPERQELVIVNFEKERAGLLIDTVVGENQTVLKPLGKHFKNQDFISGGTILGDGTIALVLDVNKILIEFSKS